ncbi:hypothetical protein SmJEL517_g04277 [Synchytrium microbalum]|uniref:Cap-specific mRNA (nucleoside-2'-O-)-methyltransferase 1 n=1 Tax=Synchytrium microbalum TaxID=1806994 RepID=A0A507C519_9FUNG|nr:uncharacterized protein SmJEL517_g04277 [Synchytrium microbalum]TPX32633.1 hypothetical protein SmJEL517_g04277 [Synchytrium microbalum]
MHEASSQQPIMDPYTDDDPEYRDTQLISPIPPPGSSSRTSAYSSTSTRNLSSSTPSGAVHRNNDTVTRQSPSYDAEKITYHAQSPEPSASQTPTFRVLKTPIPHEQTYEWLDVPATATGNDWMKMKVEKAAPLNYGQFSNQDIFEMLIELKNKLDPLPPPFFKQARMLANPYEAIGRSIFVNRAAVKMANLDALFGFTTELISPNRPFRFADVCAGPGGFTEYLLWRLPPASVDVRGFGITLRDDTDFTLEQFAPESQAQQRFEPIYGPDDTGDICKPGNMRHFTLHVDKATGGAGVDMVMADGAFSVAGDEIFQEVHCGRLLMCEVAIMFSILRKGGYYMTKVFDTTTPFTAGLLYILHYYFERICIIKPYSSRPGNSERFVVCKGLKERRPVLAINHLLKVNRRMIELSAAQDSSTSDSNFTVYKDQIELGFEHVSQLVDSDVLVKDKPFMDYLEGRNDMIATKQAKALEELIKYAGDPSQPGYDQLEIRKRCLAEWKLPFTECQPRQPFTPSPINRDHLLYRTPSPADLDKDWRDRSPSKTPTKDPIRAFSSSPSLENLVGWMARRGSRESIASQGSQGRGVDSPLNWRGSRESTGSQGSQDGVDSPLNGRDRL